MVYKTVSLLEVKNPKRFYRTHDKMINYVNYQFLLMRNLMLCTHGEKLNFLSLKKKNPRFLCHNLTIPDVLYCLVLWYFVTIPDICPNMELHCVKELG